MSVPAIITCICGVISLVITAAVTIGKPLIENTRIMTKLTDAVAALTEQMKRFESQNHDDHKRIHERIDEDARQLADHEARLKTLELSKTSSRSSSSKSNKTNSGSK